MTRYTTHLAATKTGWGKTRWDGRVGHDWSVTDEQTGLVVASGWCAGPRRDALADAMLAIGELP